MPTSKHICILSATCNLLSLICHTSIQPLAADELYYLWLQLCFALLRFIHEEKCGPAKPLCHVRHVMRHGMFTGEAEIILPVHFLQGSWRLGCIYPLLLLPPGFVVLLYRKCRIQCNGSVTLVTTASDFLFESLFIMCTSTLIGTILNHYGVPI